MLVSAETLPPKEVLDALSPDKKNPACGSFKPSPGLEPGTASLPFSAEPESKGKRGSRGSRKARKPNRSSESK
jgi:hypothetical protein